MEIFVFNLFLNRYGFKKVAEQKFTIFILSVIHVLDYFLNENFFLLIPYIRIFIFIVNY